MGLCRPVGNRLDPGGEVLGQVRRRQQPEHVGAHGIEGDVAQVEQAGIAHHDVQAQRQQHVEQREVEHAHPEIAGRLRDQRQRSAAPRRR